MLAAMMDRFVYLQVGLSIVLDFVGAKFLVSIVDSVWRTRRKRPDEFGSPRERQRVE